jgi:hypothetical protein
MMIYRVTVDVLVRREELIWATDKDEALDRVRAHLLDIGGGSVRDMTEVRVDEIPPMNLDGTYT